MALAFSQRSRRYAYLGGAWSDICEPGKTDADHARCTTKLGLRTIHPSRPATRCKYLLSQPTRRLAFAPPSEAWGITRTALTLLSTAPTDLFPLRLSIPHWAFGTRFYTSALFKAAIWTSRDCVSRAIGRDRTFARSYTSETNLYTCTPIQGRGHDRQQKALYRPAQLHLGFRTCIVHAECLDDQG